jgi:ribonuclease HI
LKLFHFKGTEISKDRNPIRPDDLLRIYTDGAARTNPGPSAYAFIFIRIRDEIEDEITRKSGYLGSHTNNFAEYTAILEALRLARQYTRRRVEVFSDCELAINQLNGEYRVKNDTMAKFVNDIYSEMKLFTEVKFEYVPRENKYIKIADKLCNECINKNCK